MKPIYIAAVSVIATLPAMAQDTREADAHEHGVSILELALEHGTLEINLTSPGADIVGFEYAASTDADQDTVESAIRTLMVPENIVTIPQAAECRLSEVLSHLHGHGYAQSDTHDHDDNHDHDSGHEHDEKHSEFHVRYKFTCAHPEHMTQLSFPFFTSFDNAQEIEATFVTDAGAGMAEIVRSDPTLSLD